MTNPIGWISAGLAAITMLGGCASYQRPMVDNAGWQPGCVQHGWGLIGMHAASQAHAVCARALEATGFVDSAMAGTTGVGELFSERGMVRIGAVEAELPADRAGIARGDLLLTVEQEPVRDPHLARRLLFGRAGTPVALSVKRGDEYVDVVLTRAPLMAMKPAAAPAAPALPPF